jgi:hypothetical protein
MCKCVETFLHMIKCTTIQVIRSGVVIHAYIEISMLNFFTYLIIVYDEKFYIFLYKNKDGILFFYTRIFKLQE